VLADNTGAARPYDAGVDPADAVLADLRVKPISLSKYRVGIALVDPARRGEPQPGSDLFA
jgi:hypothetical protein